MKWKQQLFGMKAYQPGKPIEEVKKLFGLDEVVKLASNENPFGSSPKVKQFLQKMSPIMQFIQMAMHKAYVHRWRIFMVLQKMNLF